MRAPTFLPLGKMSIFEMFHFWPETLKTLKVGEISIFSSSGLRPFGLPCRILGEKSSSRSAGNGGGDPRARARGQGHSVRCDAHAPAPLRGLGAAAGVTAGGPVTLR